MLILMGFMTQIRMRTISREAPTLRAVAAEARKRAIRLIRLMAPHLMAPHVPMSPSRISRLGLGKVGWLRMLRRAVGEWPRMTRKGRGRGIGRGRTMTGGGEKSMVTHAACVSMASRFPSHLPMYLRPRVRVDLFMCVLFVRGEHLSLSSCM